MPERVVFDCNIFAQTLITPTGNAGRCVERVLSGHLTLFWSDYVLAEILDLLNKPTPRRLGVDLARVHALIARLSRVARLVSNAPSVYRHPFDPKDSHYVDLAIASDARLIVSRDKHLLKLADPSTPAAADFASRFPHLLILPPEQLLDLLKKSDRAG